ATQPAPPYKSPASHEAQANRQAQEREEVTSLGQRPAPLAARRPAEGKRRQFMTKRGFAAGITALLVAVVVVSGVAAAAPPPAYFVDESKLPFDALPGTTTARYWGVHGGAGYRIEVPANWNGELVLYAHGFRGTGLE